MTDNKHSRCPWCDDIEMTPYRNNRKESRRRLGQVGHLVLLITAAILLYCERSFPVGLIAGILLFASCMIMYMMACGPYFNDFRVCPQCGHVEAVPKGVPPKR